MPGHAVRVVAPDVGGGFGGKQSLYQEEILVAVLAKRLGRPVGWTSDRLEDLISTSQAFDVLVDENLGLDRDGRIIALSAEVLGDVGADSIYPWIAAIEPVQVVSFLPGPYRVPTYRGRARAVATSKAPTAISRGRPADLHLRHGAADRHGRPQARVGSRRAPPPQSRSGARVPVSDREWHRLGPLGLYGKPGACPRYRRLSGVARGAGEGPRRGPPCRIGIATYAELTGIGPRIPAAPGMPINTGTEHATVRLDPTGAVTAAFGVAASGQGLETTLAQVVADELGCRIEDIQVLQGDSAVVAHGTGSYASRSAVMAAGPPPWRAAISKRRSFAPRRISSKPLPTTLRSGTPS